MPVNDSLFFNETQGESANPLSILYLASTEKWDYIRYFYQGLSYVLNNSCEVVLSERGGKIIALTSSRNHYIGDV